MTRPRTPRFGVADIAVIGVYVAGNATFFGWQAVYVGAPAPALVPDVVTALAGTIAIAVRRLRPAVAVNTAALTLTLAAPLHRPTDLFVLAVLVYSVAAGRSLRLGVITWAGLSVVAALNTTVLRLALSEPPRVGRWQVDLLLVAGAGTAALLVGLGVAARRRNVAALVALTEQLARERDRSGQLAAQAERARLAREMHDVLSHGLQVIVTSADAASAIVARDPIGARSLLAGLSDAGRRSLQEARAVFRILDDPDAGPDSAPQPTLDAVPALMEHARTGGLHVDFVEHGSRRLDPARQLVVYRVTQEALTNTLRHAGPGSLVRVRLAHTTTGSTLEIVDAGPPPDRPAPPRTEGRGSGLAGLRHRVGAVSGRFETGPRGERPGWRVHAAFPVADHPREDA